MKTKNKIVYVEEYFARVMDHRYAQCFLNGDIWINPIRVYSRLENMDGYRSDFYENSSSSIIDLNNSMFSNYPELETNFAGQVCFDYRFSSINTLCFYLYKLDLENGLILPDKQMALFGDSVIIICNPEEFFYRVTDEIRRIYPDAFFMLHEVSYYDRDISQEKLNPIFSKRMKYCYQNELRFAVSKYGKPLDSEVCNKNKTDNSPIKINIGSIRDIAFSISSDWFLSIPVYYYNQTKSEQRKNTIIKELLVNAKQFNDNYEPDSNMSYLISLYEGFDKVDYKDPGVNCLMDQFAKDVGNASGKFFEID